MTARTHELDALQRNRPTPGHITIPVNMWEAVKLALAESERVALAYSDSPHGELALHALSLRILRLKADRVR